MSKSKLLLAASVVVAAAGSPWLLPTEATAAATVIRVCLGLLLAIGGIFVHLLGRETNGTVSSTLKVAGLLLAAGGLVFQIATIWQRTSSYADTINVETVESFAEVDDFAARPPYSQALALLQSNAGDAVGTISEATYVDGEWCGLVEGDGMFRPTTRVVCWDGTGNTPDTFTTADFTPPVAAPNGLWWNSLKREIRRQSGSGTYFDVEDMYPYIDDEGEAVIVWPFTRLYGVANVHSAPAGIVTIDGAGHIEVITDAETIAQVPGPSYPIHLARIQRERNEALWGLWNAWIMHRQGWQDASSTQVDGRPRQDPFADDGTDPNTGNVSEYTLMRADGKLAYVTPLTRRGSSASIVAYAMVDASGFTPGELNDVKIVELPSPIKGNVEAEALIRGQYPELPWASGLKVMEVTPTADGLRRATIGQTMDVLYEATIGTDGTVMLNVLAQRATTSNTNTNNTEYGELSTEQLIEIRNAVQAELDARLTR